MNPYDVLGLSVLATEDRIHRTYRKLVAEHHPDRHGGSREAHERVVELNAAYEQLKTPEGRERACFDHFAESVARMGLPYRALVNGTKPYPIDVRRKVIFGGLGIGLLWQGILTLREWDREGGVS